MMGMMNDDDNDDNNVTMTVMKSVMTLVLLVGVVVLVVEVDPYVKMLMIIHSTYTNAGAAENLNSGYSKYEKVACVHYF